MTVIRPAPTKTFLCPPRRRVIYEDDVVASVLVCHIARGIFTWPKFQFGSWSGRSFILEYTARTANARNPLGSRVQSFFTRCGKQSQHDLPWWCDHALSCARSNLLGSQLDKLDFCRRQDYRPRFLVHRFQ